LGRAGEKENGEVGWAGLGWGWVLAQDREENRKAFPFSNIYIKMQINLNSNKFKLQKTSSRKIKHEGTHQSK
jgi:hypothetical protein